MLSFCKDCGTLLTIKEGKYYCKKCKKEFEMNMEDKKNLVKTNYRQAQDILIVDGDETLGTKPTIQITCPQCGHNLAEWWLRQLRSADESEVRFFRCTKCHHTWREYD